MDRLSHASYSALRAAMARQAATANNLANAGTTGFRADVAAGRAVKQQSGGKVVGGAATEQIVSAEMSPGTVPPTVPALDVALNADALLTVRADKGEEAYPRRGDLQVTATGLVTTGDG